jgi:hypothetical protein
VTRLVFEKVDRASRFAKLLAHAHRANKRLDGDDTKRAVITRSRMGLKIRKPKHTQKSEQNQIESKERGQREDVPEQAP